MNSRRLRPRHRGPEQQRDDRPSIPHKYRAPTKAKTAPAAGSPRPAAPGSSAPAGAPDITFASLLRSTAAGMGLAETLLPEPSPLAALPYEKELELKNATLRKFWELHQIPDKPNLVIPSPNPRHYRSTSKRRLLWKRDHFIWDFFAQRPAGIKVPKEEDFSLEPASHEAVYRKALEKLNEEPYRNLAGVMNFLIVRGDREVMVIVNVHRTSAEIARKAKLLAQHLIAGSGVTVAAVHLFHDASRSDYYLESRGPENAQRLKRLEGPEFLPLDVAGTRYFLHPLGFFQVNFSIVPRLLEEVARVLKPDKTARLLDLYCGCGLFSVPLAKAFREVLGVEMSPVSIESARRSASLAKARNTRFTAGKIEPGRLPRLLPPVQGTEILLLDPPKQGTDPGLIRALAERKPLRVAHLFCDMDVLPVEVQRWRKQGYMVAKAVPFDMFPGTDNLEMMVVLIPDKYGILNRRPTESGRPGQAPVSKAPQASEGKSRQGSGAPERPKPGKSFRGPPGAGKKPGYKGKNRPR